MIENNPNFILIIMVTCTCTMYKQNSIVTEASDCIILKINQVIGTSMPLSIFDEIRKQMHSLSLL